MTIEWGDCHRLKWATYTTNARDLPSLRKFVSHATATLVGSKIYMFGQFLKQPSPGTCVVCSVDHRPSSGAMKWETKELTGPRILDHSATLANERIYIFGGLEKGTDHGVVKNLLRCFDVVVRDFVPCCSHGHKPYPRLGHSSDFVDSSQQLVFFGGETKLDGVAVNLDDTHCLDIESLTWFEPKLVGSAPAPRSHHAHCVVADTLFICGGKNVHGYIFADCHLLLRVNDFTYQWSSPRWAYLPKSCAGATLSHIGSKLVLVGGKLDGDGHVSKDVEILDLRRRRWASGAGRKKGDYHVIGKKTKTVHHAAVATLDKIVVLGGSSFPFEYCRVLYESHL